MDQNNPVYIKNVAKSIRNLLQDKDFYQSIVQFFRDYADFPNDVDEEILKNLLDNENTEEQLLNDYLFLSNRQNASELYQLHINIFSLMSSSSSSSSCNIGEDDDVCYYEEDEDSSTPEIKKMLPITSIEEIGENQEKSIFNISQKYDINIEIIEALYQHFQFNMDSLLREITINLKSCIEQIGLENHSIQMPIHFKKHKKRSENVQCEICYEDETNKELVLYSLPCKHYFCSKCIADHIETYISKCKTEIKCPYSECKCSIIRRDIIKFCGYELAKKNFILEIKKEIETKPEYHFCGREGCPGILTIASVGIGNVATCASCGYQLCWNCKEASHAPLDCKLLPKWREIAKEENTELDWIKRNTKACPKCHERIERNGGCTYIKCVKCNYEFCYVCGKHFPNHKNHNYSCTKFVDFDNVTLPQNIDMKRLSFYLTRFLSNKVSHENEIKQREQRQNELLHIFTDYFEIPSERMNINEAMLLTNEIFNTIDEARSIIIWSYPHAFFMKADSKELKLFEYALGNLSNMLENLVIMVENKDTIETPKKYKQMVKNVKLYSKSLMLHVYNPNSNK